MYPGYEFADVKVLIVDTDGERHEAIVSVEEQELFDRETAITEACIQYASEYGIRYDTWFE